MIKEITGDLIQVGQEAHGLICHQTNFQGVMGAGVAYSIQQKVLTPEQYSEYQQLCLKRGARLLGTNQYLVCDDGGAVVNMFCQNDFTTGTGTLTSYAAMRMCMIDLRREAEARSTPVFLPGRIGCGIAGGNWNIVKKIIEDVLGGAAVPVTIVYWDGDSQRSRATSERLRPGDPVWVVERDEDGEPCDVSGYMFLAEVRGYVILSAYINDLESIEETLDYHADETYNNYDTDLAVFPTEDCFSTQEAAHEALGK